MERIPPSLVIGVSLAAALFLEIARALGFFTTEYLFLRWLPWILIFGVAVAYVLVLAASSHPKPIPRPKPIEAKQPEVAETPAEADPPKPVAVELPPLPPRWASPYLFNPFFVGRVGLRNALSDWYQRGRQNVCVLTGLRGSGKSSLAWVWTHEDVVHEAVVELPEATGRPAQEKVSGAPKPGGLFWWSFRSPDARFGAFLDAALDYASGGEASNRKVASSHEKTEELWRYLARRKIILVLDGFDSETWSGSSASLPPYLKPQEEAQSADPTCVAHEAAVFLNYLVARPTPSRVLITASNPPAELKSRSEGCRWIEVGGLATDEVVQFFRRRFVTGSDVDLLRAAHCCDEQPLSMALMASMIETADRSRGDISAVVSGFDFAARLSRSEIVRHTFNGLDAPRRQLLSRLAAVCGRFDAATADRLGSDLSIGRSADSMREFIGQGLLQTDRERSSFELHSLIRSFAYSRLSDAFGAHAILRDERPEAAGSPSERSASMSSLVPLIHLYIHTALSGAAENARVLFRDKLQRPLMNTFHAYECCAELLQLLFPYGVKGKSALDSAAATTWATVELASALGLSGKRRRAARVLESLADDAGTPRSSDASLVALGQLAEMQVKLGEFKAAEQSLERYIAVCKVNKDEFREAIGHRMIGELLTLMGQFEEASAKLSTAETMTRRSMPKQELAGVWTARSQWSLAARKFEEALEFARKSLDAMSGGVKIEISVLANLHEAEWQMAAALVGLGTYKTDQQRAAVGETSAFIDKLLNATRGLRLGELQAKTLLVRSKSLFESGQSQAAFEDLEIASLLADRVENRLLQADVALAAAQNFHQIGESEKSRSHARRAVELAKCGSARHVYKPVLDATRMLV